MHVLTGHQKKTSGTQHTITLTNNHYKNETAAILPKTVFLSTVF